MNYIFELTERYTCNKVVSAANAELIETLEKCCFVIAERDSQRKLSSEAEKKQTKVKEILPVPAPETKPVSPPDLKPVPAPGTTTILTELHSQ